MIILAFLFFFVLGSWYVTRDFLFPSVLMPLIWFFVLLIGLLSGFKTPGFYTQFYLFSAFFSYFIFTNFSFFLGKKYKADNFENHTSLIIYFRRIKLFGFLLIPIFGIVTVHLTFEILRFNNLAAFFINVRKLNLNGKTLLDELDFFSRKIYIFSNLFLYFFVSYLSRINKIKLSLKLFFVFYFIVSSILLLIEGARSGFYINCLVVFFLFKFNNKISLKLTFLLFFLGLTVFILIMGFRDNSDSFTDFISDVDNIILNITFYIASGPSAFDYVFNNFQNFQVSQLLTLNSIESLFNKMNLISNYNYAISNSVDDSFNVNILKKGYKAGNVYSQFYPLINDFGIFGSIIVFSITGFVSGLIYRFRRYFIISIIYSMILAGILLSPFSEYFLTLFITPGFLFFILFIFYLKRPNFIWK